MPRRKQSNPQPVKLGVQLPDAPLVVDPNCLVLDSDFLLSGDLEFGDSDIMGLDKDSVTVFSLSVEEDSSVPADASLSFFSCKRCGKLLPDSLLATGIHLGVGLDLSSDLYCLSCEEDLQSPLSTPKQVKTGRKKKQNGKNNSPSKLYSCSLCSFTSRYSNHLKRHTRIHEGQKPFRCGVCSYASTQLVNLQRHLRSHTGEKPYWCETCNYACSSHSNLRRHQRTHATEQKRKNTTAGKRAKKRKSEEEEEVVSTLTLSQSGFLSLGSLESSSPLPALLFPVLCRICGKTLEEEEDIQNERGDMDTEGQVCRRCSSESSPSSTSRPRRKTSKNKLYRCSLCPFFSHYPYHLTRHLLTHNSTKSHRCPHCSYASSHQDNLRRHLRVHTGEKPFACSTCSYACGNLANLKRHERVHTGAKPFHCFVCGYSCNQSMNLKRHMLRHTGYKPYECEECSYTTGHWDNYKRHQRKHGHNTENWDKTKYKTKSETLNIGNENVDSIENSSLDME
ncbi:zinc finger protein 513-like isoform X1 [Periophthalmus magnuspinnatus]|uniref:zinc finger protein 513-like isoform X1 n=1 Tax=Periophthalmus magnuspinnatus TaxID=409849 RepID=UPI00145A878D|nr:zinc finger protein 513-like isoform X1 [Periophthalmus magnuspinnatus]